MARVVIAGAGISGLALARALRGRGIETLVLETEPRAGGNIRSDRVDGHLCEWGPAGLPADHPDVARLVRALDLEGRLVRAMPAARRRCLALGGTLHAVPSSPGGMLRWPALSARAKLRALCDLVLPRGPAARGEDESVGAFARRRLGAVAAERLFYPLVSGMYAGDAEQISLPAALPRLAELEREHRSLLLGLARSRGRGLAQSAGALASFSGGVEDLTRALAADLGGALRLAMTVRRVDKGPGGFRLRVEERGRLDVIDADAVVLAMPAHAAAPAVAALDGAAVAALEAIPYVPVTLVHLGWDDSALGHPPDAYGFLVPTREPMRVLGGVFASAVFPGRAPEGHALVSLRVGGARRPELAALPDDDLVALCRADVEPLIGAVAPPSFVRVVRHRRALPQYTLGHRERIAALDAAEVRHAGLYFAGNAYRGLGIPDCVRNAETLADRIARAESSPNRRLSA
ncbi:MAG: protoporphyrinogen oxidase [Myxococcota bacterium]